MPAVIPLALGLAATVGALAVLPATVSILGIALTASFVAGIIGTVVSTAASLIMGGVMRPRGPTAEFQDRRQAIRSGIAPRQVVYGEARVGGAIVFAGSSGPDLRQLHLVVVLATHPCEAVDAVWINDIRVATSDLDADGNINDTSHPLYGSFLIGSGAGTPATTNNGRSRARIRIYLGDQTTADPVLKEALPADWTDDHILAGCTYLAIRLTYDQERFAKGLQGISAEMRGKNDILDPRDNSTGYTTNWALCVRDYLRSPLGLDCDAEEIDEPSFIAAANLSDEAVALDEHATETEPRYRLDGAFLLDQGPLAIMEGMLSAGAGTLVYVQGRYRLHGGAYATPTLALGPSDFAGDVQLVTRPPRREVFNAIRGTYIAKDRDWQVAEFPPATFAGFEAEDGERIWRELRLPFTIHPTRAQRLARIATLTSRDSLRFTAPMKYGALRLAAWQMVSVTHPDFGWAAKPFRVESWRFDPSSGQVVVGFREENAASYAWDWDDGASVPPAPRTTLVDPLALPAPGGLVVTPSSALQPDGSLAATLVITWDAALHPFVTSHEVQWRVTDGAWSGVDVPFQDPEPEP